MKTQELNTTQSKSILIAKYDFGDYLYNQIEYFKKDK